MDPWIVQISNWPPATIQWTEIGALAIAVVALVISALSYKRSSERFEQAQKLSKETFRQQNRPYVWPIDHNDADITKLAIVTIGVANRPALIRNMEITWWTEKNGKRNEIDKLTLTKRAFYPLPGNVAWRDKPVSVENHIEHYAKDVYLGTKRSIIIKYSGLEDDTEYTYESVAVLATDPVYRITEEDPPTIWLFEYEDIT